jgi:DNA helicase-2/ATP-dependent DNA helicase PcrA
MQRFEQVSWPEAEEHLRGTPQSRQTALDLAQRMRAMWR